jgi:uncharacterized protein CbrC (UPF0167 family)
MEMDEVALPSFKYHPDPLATGAIRAAQTTCPVCGQTRPYVYTGPFYAIADVEGFCPWCIKDGSAATRYDGVFQDPASCEEAVPASLDEVIHRTPGYAGWQQEVWLSHHDECCAFIGYVGWPEIQSLADELAEDLERLTADYGFSRAELERWRTGGSVQGYLFRCVVCGTHRLTADAD